MPEIGAVHRANEIGGELVARIEAEEHLVGKVSGRELAQRSDARFQRVVVQCHARIVRH